MLKLYRVVYWNQHGLRATFFGFDESKEAAVAYVASDNPEFRELISVQECDPVAPKESEAASE